MKRFHVHVSVHDIPSSVQFYSSLFGAAPSVLKRDYAKWMLEDPRINFAISNRAATTGVDHLGLQVESGEELQALEGQLRQADAAMITQTGTACCYANSDKRWVTDPQGVAWETFHTLGTVPIFGQSRQAEPAAASACCAPKQTTVAMPGPAEKPAGACCG